MTGYLQDEHFFGIINNKVGYPTLPYPPGVHPLHGAELPEVEGLTPVPGRQGPPPAPAWGRTGAVFPLGQCFPVSQVRFGPF